MFITLLRYLSLLSAILTMGCGTSLAANFYYFNPDAPQSNLARLKTGMDASLQTTDLAISFQPFARLQDFDRLVKQDNPAIVIAPDWYLSGAGQGLKLRAILRPLRHGSSTYQKVLLVPNTSNLKSNELAGKTIAMTAMGINGLDILNQLIFADQGLDSHQLTIVTTNKDIDALFALVLRQVDAALVSESNLQRIKNINPLIAKQVKIIGHSHPLSLPRLYVSRAMRAEDINKLKKLFIRKRPHAGNLLEILQIDDWQELTQ